MNRFVKSLVCFLMFVGMFSANALADVELKCPDGYYFKKYSVDVTVHENNRYSVTEKMDVIFTKSKHGIFRMIPTWIAVKRDISENQDKSESKIMSYNFEVEKVTSSEPWTDISDDYDKLFAMRMGSKDVYLEGPHSYTISYDLKFGGDRVPQADLFFHSVLGTGWDCSVIHFNFHVHFDKPLTDKELSKFQLFIGPEGSHDDGRDEFVTKATNTDIEGNLYGIYPHYGVSLYIPLREGYFAHDSALDMRIYLAWALIIISLLLIGYIIYIEVFSNRGITKVLSFYPPKGMSSADVGIVFDTEIDDRDIISLIPWFASKGYLTINNKGKQPVLNFADDLPSDAPKYQKTLFDGFFKDGKSFDCGKVPDSFGKAWVRAKAEAKYAFHDKLNMLDGRAVCILLAAILTSSFALYFAANVAYDWILGGLITVGYAVIVGVRITYALYSDDDNYWGEAIFLIIAIGFFGLGIWGTLFVEGDPTIVPVYMAYLVLLGLFIACYQSHQLAQMTPYRRKVMGELMGLEEFIRTADKQQLEHLQAEDEKYFYNVLPFAVAFGMAEKWAEKFKDITVKPVDWYTGKSSDSFVKDLGRISQHSFMSSSLMSAVKTQTTRYSSAASSSSSGSSWSSSSSHSYGGGGYSGGGSGGGGGGSW